MEILDIHYLGYERSDQAYVSSADSVLLLCHGTHGDHCTCVTTVLYSRGKVP